METDRKPAKTETSLTESWNVIEVQEVNASEGSDGESIEVIDEDSQNTDPIPSSIKEEGSITETSEASRSDGEDTTHLSNCGVIPLDDGNCDSTVASVMQVSETATSGGINLLNTCGLLVLIIALLCAGATFSVFLLKVEELAFDTFNYFSASNPYKEYRTPSTFFSSSESIKNNDKEYEELLNQIKTYKEESKDLKNLITELNSAVLSLKKDLASQKSTANNVGTDSITQVPRKDDTLFQQILNVHTDNYSQGNNTGQEKEMPYENSFKAIKEILSTYSSEYKKEDEMETIRMFSRIPKHLYVLINFDSTNQNINKFIETWEAKLLRANEKLITDIKEIQTKMTRHIIKSLRTTQKNFFNNLCQLKAMKNSQCYDTFIKPYQYLDTSSLTGPEDNTQQTAKGASSSNGKQNNNIPSIDKTKSNFDNNHPSNAKKKMKLEIKEKDLTEGMLNKNGDIKSQNIGNSPVKTLNLSEKNVESNSVPGNSLASIPPAKNPQGRNIKYEAQLNSGENNDKLAKKEKGRNSDLTQEDPNNGAINSFSSFSGGKNVQGEKIKGKVQEGSKNQRYEELLERRGEGSWFLRMGTHRSRIRNMKSRGDWLFERARYRRRRNLHCHQPWLSKIPGNFDKFSPDFLKSQGFI